ncbi:UPAR/Ly6 domain-containing protein crok-like [Centruroides vittatus]|uniref:UPAR/Ly6 domain-containing protein crok-like n=1 Tax=Centruroides vittatus TaxID=120091 RepID=UPI00350F9E26
MITTLLYIAGGTVIFFSLFHTGNGIICWECNSHYDAHCADPFNNRTLSSIDCNSRFLPHYPNTPATICRKIIQKVNDEYRYIRGCGWMTDDREGIDCIKRAGTFHVFVQYCSCQTDYCNLAPANQPNSLTIILVMIFASLISLS